MMVSLFFEPAIGQQERMVTITEQRAEVADRIAELIRRTLAGTAHNSGTEARIVEGPHRAGALS